MKSDNNGVSTCQNDKENYEVFRSAISGKQMVQYDYRTSTGKLFSCIAPTLEDCRARMHSWLIKNLQGVNI
jgi:hypothetical protein